ncbi:MAG: 2-C-methyl-D-erythritol 4-phosphate cytidylyltransferase [Puniceicoccales bacterium]|jgi:2-C-methyl-D-erythritol 4-phosphate cytidylyltransferase|nr:2-C-methyl-D-erythritol 4-phosphate cytidylyltransferase [Puniceicoccales bacterium]
MSPKVENHVIILAAGRGTRFGGSMPKQFVEVNGRPLLHYSLKTFLDHGAIDSVTVVLPEDFIDFQLPLHGKLRQPVVGDVERHRSTIRALHSLETGDNDRVLIHDAARPLVSAELIWSVCVALDGGADLVAPAIPIDDAIIDVRHLYVVERATYAALQTPQGFRVNLLRNSMARFLEMDGEDSWTPTCEFEIVRNINQSAKAQLLDGCFRNHKVTRDFDAMRLRTILPPGENA